MQESAPIEVMPARVLSHLYTYLGMQTRTVNIGYWTKILTFYLNQYLGQNKKLNLSGRRSRDVGILSTSKLYSLQDRIFAFTPQVSL